MESAEYKNNVMNLKEKYVRLSQNECNSEKSEGQVIIYTVTNSFTLTFFHLILA